MKYDPLKHNRHSIRLKGYDYSAEGAYHVVVRTKNGVCVFGEVKGIEMKLSPIGRIAESCWLEIPRHFKAIKLDTFQIMPNHLHGIIVIGGGDGSSPDVLRKDVQLNVHTSKAPFENVHTRDTQKTMSQISPHKETLSVILRTYKAAVTTACRRQGFQRFAWHNRFYDHIIRDGKDFDRIRRYILDNPLNWESDDEHPRNIRMARMHDSAENWSALD